MYSRRRLAQNFEVETVKNDETKTEETWMFETRYLKICPPRQNCLWLFSNKSYQHFRTVMLSKLSHFAT